MNASELKYQVESAGKSDHFFDRKTMRFFGDTMRNYGVRKATVRTDYNSAGDYVSGGLEVECWELYRKRPVKHGLQTSHYFACDTFRHVFPA
jgi:hypothetical protein